MSELRIQRAFTMPRDELLDTLEEHLAELEEQHGIRARRQGDTISIERGGVAGSVCIGEDAVDVRVRMGPMGRLFKPRVKKAVNRYLDKYVW